MSAKRAMELLNSSDDYKLEQDTVHLTNNQVFFPEMVWELVLGKLRKPKDIESCSNASPYFWKLLKAKRQNKVVIPFVLQKMSSFILEYQSEDNNDENHPVDDEKVSMKDFWKLREVCKLWNTTIEGVHQSSDAGHFEMRDDTEIFKNEHLRKWANERFDPLKHPLQFLNHFEATHYDFVENKCKKNPFLGRSVHFDAILIAPDMPEIFQLYFRGIQQLMIKFGEEVWYVSFVFFEISGVSLAEIYECLVECLKLMPNLKAVTVTCCHQEFAEDVQFHFQAYIETSMPALLREIIENPIPMMPKLEFIWTKDLPTPMFNELLRSNRHVTKLKVERQEDYGDYNIFEDDLPNLTALQVNFCSEKDFEKFENSRFRLKIERFYFWYDGPSELLAWSRLFRALETHMAESCQVLVIQMPSPKSEKERGHVFDDTQNKILNLPTLKLIQVVYDANIALDFLLPARQSLLVILLKYFNGVEDKFMWKRVEECEDVQDVELNGFIDRMDQSTIWEVFPKLMNFGLFRKNEMGGCVTYHHRCTAKKQHFFKVERWYSDEN